MLISGFLNTKFQLIFPTKYFNKRQNAVAKYPRWYFIFFVFIYFSFLININLMEKNNYKLTIALYKLN